MRLYSGSSMQFIQDTTYNQIADKLRFSFSKHFGFNPNESEIRSWQNSLRALSLVFQSSYLFDQGILLEYQLPMSSSRLDCLICGKDDSSKDNAVIIELKQWDRCSESSGPNEVLTIINGGERQVLHPSVQVGRYKSYLMDYHSAFYEGSDPVILNACSYLHNYSLDYKEAIFDTKFQNSLLENPIFTKDDVEKFINYLKDKLKDGNGIDVLRRIENSSYRPSKKLMNHVANVIGGVPEYTLLDEQQVVYDAVLSKANKGFSNAKKTVIIVEGGPGTGKSVIAINLMGALSAKHYNTHYATGSKAFTSTLREVIGNRSRLQLRYFNDYAKAEANAVDVLIADEAHRLWNKNISRFTPKEQRLDTLVIDQMINAAKVLVFFVDDKQVVRPNEVGSVEYINKHSKENDCEVLKFKLEAQFRCKGSEEFVNWIESTLKIGPSDDKLLTKEENFEFKLFESPEELETSIRQKVSQGKTGRVVAGFCWNWSPPNQDGTLKQDVVIGDFRRAWNAKPGNYRLAKDIPKAELWAHDPHGIDQVGCVYTAMGFEFDYVGVIFGRDLLYNPGTNSWEGHPENSKDQVVKRSRGHFLDLVKNTYRVLLSRGIKGCYVYFMDKETESFFKSRMVQS